MKVGEHLSLIGARQWEADAKKGLEMLLLANAPSDVIGAVKDELRAAVALRARRERAFRHLFGGYLSK